MKAPGFRIALVVSTLALAGCGSGDIGGSDPGGQAGAATGGSGGSAAAAATGGTAGSGTGGAAGGSAGAAGSGTGGAGIGGAGIGGAGTGGAGTGGAGTGGAGTGGAGTGGAGTGGQTNFKPPPAPAGDETVLLDPATTFQTIGGWEAHAESGHDLALTGGLAVDSFPLYEKSLFDQAVNEVGINQLRLEIWCGFDRPEDEYKKLITGKITYADWKLVRMYPLGGGHHFTMLDNLVQKVVLPVRQRLQARGEKLWLNLNYVCFNGSGNNDPSYHLNTPANYVAFVKGAFDHLKTKYGLIPDSFEVLLEPNNTNWGSQPAKFGKMVVATGAGLAAAGYTPEFIWPSGAFAYWTWPYFDAVLAAEPAAAQYLDTLAYHTYDSSGAAFQSDIAAIAQRAKQKNLKTAMLEKIGADIDRLWSDLEDVNVSHWQQFALAFTGTNDTGGSYFKIDVANPSAPKLIRGKRTNRLRQVFAYVRRDAVRFATQDKQTAVDSLAFLNADQKYTVVLNAKGGATAKVGPLPPGKYGVSWSSDTQFAQNLADVDLPAGGTLSVPVQGGRTATVYTVQRY